MKDVFFKNFGGLLFGEWGLGGVHELVIPPLVVRTSTIFLSWDLSRVNKAFLKKKGRISVSLKYPPLKENMAFISIITRDGLKYT